MFVCSRLLFNIHQHTVTVIKKYVFHVTQDLLQIRSYVYAEEPNIDIHNFIGTFTRVSVTVTVCAPDLVHAPQSHGRPTAHLERRGVSLTHPHILLRIAIICWSGRIFRMCCPAPGPLLLLSQHASALPQIFELFSSSSSPAYGWSQLWLTAKLSSFIMMLSLQK